VGRRPCLTPSETGGYLLDEAEVTFWGLCPECQTATATAPRATKRSDQAQVTPEKHKEAMQ